MNESYIYENYYSASYQDTTAALEDENNIIYNQNYISTNESANGIIANTNCNVINTKDLENSVLESNTTGCNYVIPFVQIHTTDVNPNNNNKFGNIFRRSVQNAEIIKSESEPIKSESTDVNKERVTPSNIQNGSCNNAEEANGNEIQSKETENEKYQTNAKLPTVFKCKNCMYLCLQESQLEQHESKHSNEGQMAEREIYNCAGVIICNLQNISKFMYNYLTSVFYLIYHYIF